MFEPGFDQAAGLRRDAQRSAPGPLLLPLASPALPSHAFEWLCQIAVDLGDAGHAVVVLDGTATERTADPEGLLGALDDPAIAHLGGGAGPGLVRVMPARRGLQALLATARVGGAASAVSRLLAPFADRVLVLLYAAPPDLAALLADLPARVLVPVLGQPQASIDAYGALKWLHAAGLSPVLTPFDAPAQVVANVADCARRHLSLQPPVWHRSAWAHHLPDAALVHTAGRDPFSARGACAAADPMARQPLTAHPLWS